jgi:hypothetical protein
MSDEQLGGKNMEGDSGKAKAEPSGPRGDNPATAGTGEHAEETVNPSAPGETGTTPGKAKELSKG